MAIKDLSSLPLHKEGNGKIYRIRSEVLRRFDEKKISASFKRNILRELLRQFDRGFKVRGVCGDWRNILPLLLTKLITIYCLTFVMSLSPFKP